jgi:hypothetical protein
MLRASSLRLAGAAFLFLAVAAPAAAAGYPAQTQAVAPDGGGGSGAAAEPKKERKICKKEEVTESRMGASRICKTAAEWRADGQAGPGLDDLKQNSSKVH